MVIQGINNGGIYYTSDIDSIIVKSVSGKLTFTCTVGSLSITEYYTTDSGGIVTIRELGKVIDSVFSLKDYNKSATEYVHEPLSVSLKFADNSGSNIISFQAVYSKAVTGKIPGDNNVFLSRYRIVKTNKSRLEFVTVFKTNTIKLIAGIAYLSSGKAKFKKVTLSVTSKTDCTYTRLVSLKNISSAAGVNVDSVLFYEIYLYDNDTLTDKIRYDVKKEITLPEVNFLYRNPFGGFDTLSFTGYQTDMPENDFSINSFLGTQRRYSTSIKDIHKAYSGYISNDIYNAIKDMLLSTETYIMDKDFDVEEIVIKESEMERTLPSNEVYGVSVTYYPSQDNHYRFDRGSAVSKRIFDKTFDHTFD